MPRVHKMPATIAAAPAEGRYEAAALMCDEDEMKLRDRSLSRIKSWGISVVPFHLRAANEFVNYFY
jgi:hypothetical protein